mmetsp:Transcript_12068/g.28599  ORF Transcript_12068/g.28599 Transcript_12068/m.28599 type:complete len:345 (-) Transcript_12068:278-1312(-)
MAETSVAKKAVYGLTSFLVGVCTFVKINEISGPRFEPIIAACQNPDIPFDEFASTTGYHRYDPIVGLKAFDFLVCLITQFLLELRQTHPSGLLVWAGVVLASMPVTCIATIEGGRAGARGPIRYPTILGLLYQLFGISVGFPMIWVPSFVFGEGKRRAPVTSFRLIFAAQSILTVITFTAIVFAAPTDSQLWTTSAGILGGPILALLGLALFTDASPKLVATKESGIVSSVRISKLYKVIMVLGLIGWYSLVAIAYQTYGTSLSNFWNDVWVNAGPSVAFMTIDTGVLYLGVLMYIAYRHGELKAVKALSLTAVLGPAAAALFIMNEAENEMDFAHLDDEKKGN